MSRIVDLTEYKQQRKKLFLEKNKTFLDDYIRGFIYSHCQLSYDVFQQHYLNARQQDNEMAWDYLDFRDTLAEVVTDVIGASLWTDIQRQPWFRKGLLNRDEVMDRMISLFIIGAAVAEG
ncbi:hypothetical protein [Pseudobacteriovorax antillogorgiicola]|uniref:Uncharacterized protein n=1 Tax=Pseudobacteriovorax antillogorgiicola TaxID=1513793 RepID=A0A1Y6BQ64_9BACT|nr:hypothetical protein [Pseudobacteriovorax antillogorgiicola]TCS53843.1 hypothetical protein EDD56_107152 [Pseudobacteriovorax antillogorgiicola]SMF21644.1 hypothetical protein SAMN06296036_107120 [Pseudobacteriovorax antillogorgiicola]